MIGAKIDTRSCATGYSLVTLGLDRLDVRRLRFDLIFVYKIIFGMVEIDASTFFQST